MTLPFENELARHCAPVLMGIEPTSLFTTSFTVQEIEQWADILRKREMEIHIFSKNNIGFWP